MKISDISAQFSKRKKYLPRKSKTIQSGIYPCTVRLRFYEITIYLAGFDSSGKSTYYDDFWRFHFPTSKWEEMSSNSNKPKKRSSASGGIHEDDSSFVLSHGANDDDQFSNTFSYDIDQPASTRAWEEIYSGTNNYNPIYPHARYQQAGSMVSKDKLLLFGGCLR
jgi:hypothetical protein